MCICRDPSIWYNKDYCLYAVVVVVLHIVNLKSAVLWDRRSCSLWLMMGMNTERKAVGSPLPFHYW